MYLGLGDREVQRICYLGTFRTDILHLVKQLPGKRIGIWQSVLGVFLPAGYPQSVTDDYMWYANYSCLLPHSPVSDVSTSLHELMSRVGIRFT